MPVSVRGSAVVLLFDQLVEGNNGNVALAAGGVLRTELVTFGVSRQ
jgi:hypothetical protein